MNLRNSKTNGNNRCKQIVALTICILITSAAVALAAEKKPRQMIEQANQEVKAGKYDQALETYKLAGESLPDSPEIAYNSGVVHYRKGDFEKAAEMFTKALVTREQALEAKTKFNLGNCAYSQALANPDDIEKALEHLRLAVAHYGDAINADPKDMDARANMEMAQLLMRDLLDKQKQQQEKEKEQEDKKEEQENPTSQPQSQPHQQPQSQPASQPQSQPAQQQQQEQQQDEKQQQQQSADQQQGDQKQEQGQAQAVPAQIKSMTKEEAEKLLQAVRDKEKKRREEQAQLLILQQVPVDKDW